MACRTAAWPSWRCPSGDGVKESHTQSSVMAAMKGLNVAAVERGIEPFDGVDRCAGRLVVHAVP
jgi:hypothetical protein